MLIFVATFQLSQKEQRKFSIIVIEVPIDLCQLLWEQLDNTKDVVKFNEVKEAAFSFKLLSIQIFDYDRSAPNVETMGDAIGCFAL